MHAPRIRVDMILKRIRISRFQLGDLAPVENAARQLMFGGQILQHIGAGGIGAGLAAFAALQRHFVKQDFAQLLGRSDIELAPGKLVDFLLQRRHFLRKGA